MESRLGFIGAGKVAVVLGRYLNGHGLVIGGYYDRTTEKAVLAADRSGGRPYSDPDEAVADCKILLITTQDEFIESACKSLVQTGKVGPGHWLGHVSGAHSSQLLTSAAQAGAATFSLHPLQAFAEEERALAEMSQTYFTLEGTDPRLERIEAILRRTGNPFFRIDAAGKRFYHLAACIFSNYLVTLLARGLEALSHSGIDPHQGVQAVLPLIRGTIKNVAELGPAEALTGPVARGDAATVSIHLQALDDHKLTDLREFYTYMGLETLKLSSGRSSGEHRGAEAVRRMFERG